MGHDQVVRIQTHAAQQAAAGGNAQQTPASCTLAVFVYAALHCSSCLIMRSCLPCRAYFAGSGTRARRWPPRWGATRLTWRWTRCSSLRWAGALLAPRRPLCWRRCGMRSFCHAIFHAGLLHGTSACFDEDEDEPLSAPTDAASPAAGTCCEFVK